MQRAPAFRKPPKVPVPYENGKSMDSESCCQLAYPLIHRAPIISNT